MVRVAVALLLSVLVPSVALAEKRIALLIGNQSYGNEIGRLANPHNDIALLERSLKGLGFEVETVRDAGLAALHQAVNAHVRRVRAAGSGAIGFFYYSGHGAQDAATATNYLIPVDVTSPEDGDLWDRSLRLTEVTRKLKSDAGNAIHFVIFDACRNALKLRQTGTRALVQSKGFLPASQEAGMLIAYATAEGELASDVGAGAGPYAKVLAEEIVKPGIEAVPMFRRVQVRVRAAIGQEPWLGFSALGEVHFAGLNVEAPKPPPAPAPAQPQLSEAERAWAAIKDSTDARDFEAFRRQYGRANPFYDRLAERRIEDLKKQQVAVATTPPAARPTAPAKEPLLPGLLDKTLDVVLPRDKPGGRCDGVEALVGHERKCVKPKDTFRDCPECPEMVVVPAGEFMMGSHEFSDAKPVRKIAIAKPFAVGKFEVTFATWDACVSDGGCKHKPDDKGWGRGNRPVMSVSWDDVTKEYMPWLSRKTAKTYRLLTEAEWEYAARAGSGAKYTWGDDIGKKLANCDGCGSQWDYKQTAPVGSFQANAFGLHDMHGNVMEWVADCYKDYANAPADGKAASDALCPRRVVRGGSWIAHTRFLHSAYRGTNGGDHRSYIIGFRVARTL